MSAMQQWLTRAANQRSRRGNVRAADEPRPVAAAPLDLASNDYLGLSLDPRVKQAAIRAIECYGTGARASRVVTGTVEPHLELERELCALTGQTAALVFSSGYAANVGLLTALGRPGALILTDEHAHASLIDGARLSRAETHTFPHGDLEALRRALADRRAPRAIVVVESIYSVLGDSADLVGTAALCAQYDALLVVDEAHAIGVVGAGRGAVHAAGLAGAEHVVVTATMSKALGAQGGAVLASALLRQHLVNTARTFIFDTGLAPGSAAAAAEACRIVTAEPQRVAAVGHNAERIATAWRADRAPGPVQSLAVGRAEVARSIAGRMRAVGILVGCFCPPSVPDGISRIRVTANATCDPERLEWAAEQIAATVTSPASAS